MKRREFITLAGGAAMAWPLAVRAQQPAMLVIGLLSGQRPELSIPQVTAFYRGLGEAGFFEGRNIAIESRWANNDYTRYPALAVELAQRRVALIAAIAHGSTPATLAAKTATATIPIVFAVGSDAVKAGIVASLNRPGGNVTGATFFANELAAKRLGLLHELLPKASVIGVLTNANFPGAEDQLRDIREAARALRLEVFAVNATTDYEIEQGFATLAARRTDGLFVGADPFLSSRQERVIALAARQNLPAIYDIRLAAEAGGLISYGADSLDTQRWAGVYAGRILKGERPSDLPVLQPTRFELIINLKTSKQLNLEIPANLIARADEVIE
jgi:putative tryptophan/tyrosine transport system substrate-binding protein